MTNRRTEVIHMPRILEPSDINNIISEYQAGASTRELGRKYGVQPQSLLIRLKNAGVSTRSIADAKRLHHPPIDIPALLADYQQGESINALAKRFGISRRSIESRLLSNGIQLRTQSDAERLKWSKMNPDARERQVAKAHAASKVKFKGIPPSYATLVGKSEMWQRTGRMTRSEASVSAILTDLGIPHTPQYVVGTYNIDLAVNEMPIAVEVASSGIGKTYGPKLRRKLEHLFSRGWLVLFIYALSGNRNDLTRINQNLPSWLDRARRDKSIFGRYGVIRCDSKDGPIFRRYLDGLPFVEGP